MLVAVRCMFIGWFLILRVFLLTVLCLHLCLTRGVGNSQLKLLEVVTISIIKLQ
jgi:hypothetical protein